MEANESTPGAGESDRVKELKEIVAGRIRTDSGERAILSPVEEVAALVPEGPHGGFQSLLEEMAAEEAYADIRAVTTASGLVFLFSRRHIPAAEAIGKSRIEDLKFTVAEKVRADSRDLVVLTHPAVLCELAPGMDREGVGSLLEEMRSDARYVDVKATTASTGEVFYYSEKHMSNYYALLLTRVAGKDPCATIAETVRDESRIYPRPTCAQLFLEKLFEVTPCDLEPIVEETLKRPGFEDIRKIVHPETGGVYLYSSLYLNGDLAYSMMDWQEVGKDANP